MGAVSWVDGLFLVSGFAMFAAGLFLLFGLGWTLLVVGIATLALGILL